jgi:hypothetical protein
MASDTSQGAPIARAPDPGPPLDPALLQVIRSSAGRLTQLQDAFIRQLRADIITMIPDLAEDGWAFSDRMVRAVLWAATTDQPAQMITDGLRWLGAANWREGFPETQYVSVAHALVRAVHVLSESDWYTSLGSAWISYFLWMKPYLILGAQQAAQQAAQEAAQQAAQEAAGLVQGPPGGHPPVPDGDVDRESVGNLLDDEDEDDVGTARSWSR